MLLHLYKRTFDLSFRPQPPFLRTRIRPPREKFLFVRLFLSSRIAPEEPREEGAFPSSASKATLVYTYSRNESAAGDRVGLLGTPQAGRFLRQDAQGAAVLFPT